MLQPIGVPPTGIFQKRKFKVPSFDPMIIQRYNVFYNRLYKSMSKFIGVIASKLLSVL